MIGYACVNLNGLEPHIIGELPKTSQTSKRLYINDEWVPVWKIEFDAPVGFEFPSPEKLCDASFPKNMFPFISDENITPEGLYDEMAGTLTIAQVGQKVEYRKLSFLNADGSEIKY